MVIVILIMTLLSLIVLAMTKNANREQEQSLERQLSSQAFYAAESGINDARDYFTQHAHDAVNPAPTEKKMCDGSETGATAGNQFPGYLSRVGSNVNHYSCVLYDTTPESLVFSNVGTSDSVVMPLQDDSGNAIDSLTFTWKRPNDANYDFSNCNALFSSGYPKEITDCDAGVLRIELIDTSDINRTALINNDFVAFVSPGTGGSSTKHYVNGLGVANQGVSWQGDCTSGINGECKLKIDGISRTRLMLHMRSVYNVNEVRIEGVNTPSGEKIEFKNAQMMIDSTGKASDVLKRIQVRVSLNQYSNGVYPEFSLNANGAGICKLLQIIPHNPDSVPSSDGC